MFFRNLKALSHENQGLTHALSQIKELFVESLVEKDQEILILKENLAEFQRNFQEKEREIAEITHLLRKTAIDAEEREETLRNLNENARKSWENEYFRRVEAEKQRIYAKLSKKYESLEEKCADLQGKLSRERHIHAENVKQLREISAENENLQAELAKVRKIQKETLGNHREISKRLLEKEQQFVESFQGKEQEIKELSRVCLEKEQNLLVFVNKSQIFASKYAKWRGKCLEERRNAGLFRDEIAKNRELLVESREKCAKLQEILEETREKLANSRLLRRKSKEIAQTLGEELQNAGFFEETQGNVGDFFEKVRGNEVLPSKYAEIRRVFEDFEDVFNENWENALVSEEIRSVKAQIFAILARIQRDFSVLKGNLQEIEREKEEYKRNLREFVKKFEENEKKVHEKKGFLTYLWG